MISGDGGAADVVVLDACVLIPSALSDTLLRVAQAGLYRPCWTEEILEEVRRNLVRAGLTDDAGARRRMVAMRTAFPKAMVDGYEHLIPVMTNHPKDRHVLAAGVAAKGDLIVTLNLRDFRNEAVDGWGIAAASPDDFLLGLFEQEPEVLSRIVRAQGAALRRPPLTAKDVLQALALHTPRFVVAVAPSLGL